MKVYSIEQYTPANSQARVPREANIPPWFFKGYQQAGVSGEWPPPYEILLTGGYINTTMKDLNKGSTGFAIVKNNVFVQNEVLATGLMNSGFWDPMLIPLEMKNPMGSGPLITPYDRLQVVIFTDVGANRTSFGNITVQLEGIDGRP